VAHLPRQIQEGKLKTCDIQNCLQRSERGYFGILIIDGRLILKLEIIWIEFSRLRDGSVTVACEIR
jgi:hypothetical protein